MDTSKKTVEDFRKLDEKKLREEAESCRKQLAQFRMDIYTAAAANVGKIRHTKKSLARVLTVLGEKRKPAVAKGK